MKGKQSHNKRLNNVFLTVLIIILSDHIANVDLSSYVSERFKLYQSVFLT